jgi:translation initiation factor IF-3
MKHQPYRPYPINRSIQAKEVFTLGPDKKPLGVKPISEALALARQMGLDLILISPKSNPPVCQIEDFGRFMYRHNKEEHPHKAARCKEVQLSANIFEHDLEIKVRHTKEFLSKGHPVKVILRLHGREKAHPEVGRRTIQKFLAQACAALVPSIQQQGGMFSAFIRA